VSMFAELHGGKAWVQERAGGGASFRVLLPAGPQGDARGADGDVIVATGDAG
jgi:signal transduction histidine kinase